MRKYNHEMLHSIIVYKTKTRPKRRSHVWQTIQTLAASIGM